MITLILNIFFNYLLIKAEQWNSGHKILSQKTDE